MAALHRPPCPRARKNRRTMSPPRPASANRPDANDPGSPEADGPRDDASANSFAAPSSPPTSRARRLKLSPIDPGASLENRIDQARESSLEAFAKTGSWVVYFREILGRDGVCRKLFPSEPERRYFETTEVFAEMQEIIAAMRSQGIEKSDAAEPEKMITIRLPLSVHESLVRESGENNLSVNKLCISKLLQSIDRRFLPDTPGKVPGRKPGPQSPAGTKREK